MKINSIKLSKYLGRNCIMKVGTKLRKLINQNKIKTCQANITQSKHKKTNIGNSLSSRQTKQTIQRKQRKDRETKIN